MVTDGGLRGLLFVLILVAAACSDGAAGPDTQEVVDPCTTAEDIAVGDARTGSLGPDDCLQEDGAYSDRWSLSLDAEADIRIDLESPSFEGVIELQGAGGFPVEYGVDGPEEARLIARLAPGDHIVLVRPTFTPQSGSYVLSVSPGPDCSAVGQVAIGDTVAGTLGDGDCVRSWEGRADNWSLTLAEERRVRVDLSAPDFDEILLLENELGEVWWGSGWNHPSGHARIEAMLGAGEWNVVATTPLEATSGDYELSVGEPPACTPGTSLTLGETVDGSIDDTDCVFEGFALADSFAVTLDETTPVSFSLKSLDFSPLVVVRDTAQVDVAVGFDQTDTGSAVARAVLEAGMYAIYAVAGSYSEPPGGDFTLTVDEIVCDEPEPITFGETVEGTLSQSDCVRDEGQLQDVWQLDLAEETTARIDLTSEAFDAWLILEDDAGGIIETDDDDGTGFDARIERTLAAGTYVIRASSYSPFGSGAYRLSIGDPPASNPEPAASEASPRGIGSKTADGPAAALERYLERARPSSGPYLLAPGSIVR